MAIIIALLGYIGVGLKDDLGEVTKAERKTSDAVKSLEVELVREISSTNRRLDQIGAKLDNMVPMMGVRP
jgi:hypothetical protein